MKTTDSQAPEGFVPFPVDGGFIHLIGPLYCRIAGGRSALGFRVADKHLNPAGICHGGVTMAIADMAVGFAALLESGRRAFPPSINNTYDFLATAHAGDWLETSIPFVKATRRMAFADGFLMRGDEPILRFSGICRLPRDDDHRYAGLGPFESLFPDAGEDREDRKP